MGGGKTTCPFEFSPNMVFPTSMKSNSGKRTHVPPLSGKKLDPDSADPAPPPPLPQNPPPGPRPRLSTPSMAINGTSWHFSRSRNREVKMARPENLRFFSVGVFHGFPRFCVFLLCLFFGNERNRHMAGVWSLGKPALPWNKQGTH